MLFDRRRHRALRDAQRLYPLRPSGRTQRTDRDVRPRKREVRSVVFHQKRPEQREGQYVGIYLHGRSGRPYRHGADRPYAAARRRGRGVGIPLRGLRRGDALARLSGRLHGASGRDGPLHGQPEQHRHRVEQHLLPERARFQEREHVHDGRLPRSGRRVDRRPVDERGGQGGEDLFVGGVDRLQAAVLLVGAHRPRRLPLRRRGVRYRIARFGAYQGFFGRDGRTLYGPDRTVRLLVLLRSQQVRRVEENRRRAGPIAAARPADPHGLGHYRVGEPLAGDPRLRFPAAV